MRTFWGALALLCVLSGCPKAAADDFKMDVRNDTCEPKFWQWVKLGSLPDALLSIFNERRHEAAGCIYAKVSAGTFVLLMLDISRIPLAVIEKNSGDYDYALSCVPFASEGEWWRAHPPDKYINYYDLLQEVPVILRGKTHRATVLISWRKDRSQVGERETRRFREALLGKIKLKTPAP